jgi:hypothetical protein
MSKFSDGSTSGYAELPVPAAYLSWTRGNAALKSIAQADPGAFYGGWRAFVTDKESKPLPTLPLPVVERTSEDGKHLYKVFASNFVSFVPLQHRTRYELRQKTKDEQTGREYERVVSISQEKREGYAPYRQVFGLLYDPKTDDHAPAVLKVFKWSAFITFTKAGERWNKIDKLTPEDQVLVRRYGSFGKDGVPNFEIYGQGRSTPIEAIGTDKPRLIPLTDEMTQLFEASEAWKNCERWNAEGKVAEEDTASTKSVFLAKCQEVGFSNIEIEQYVAEANGDYKKALETVFGPDAINGALESSEGELPF